MIRFLETISLVDWIEYWRQEFGAVTHTNFGGHILPEAIDTKWIRIVERLEEQAEIEQRLVEDGKRKHTPSKDMLDKLLGPQLLKYASDAYWETSSMIKAEIPLPYWEQMDNSQKGRIIAHNRISNAVEGLTRYAHELKLNAERAKQKRNNPKAPRTKGRRRR